MTVIEKAIKVILSCNSKSQLDNAIKYANLANLSFHLQGGTDRLGKSILPLERAIAVQKYRLGLLGNELTFSGGDNAR